MKKLRTTLLTIATLLCSIAASAHDFVVDGIYYNITSSEDLTVSVTYEGDQTPWFNQVGSYSGEVVIPESVTYNRKTYSVTSIGYYAFQLCSDLTSVAIPNSVTSIGDYAFSICSSLMSISIPNSVTSIGEYVFNGTGWWNNQSDGLIYLDCHLLGYKGDKPDGEVTIKDGTKYISTCAFYGCSGLTSITIPNSVTSIGSSAFYDCSSLMNVTIGNSVTKIGEYAFSGCSALTSVTIPNSVTSIGAYAFYDCYGLETVINFSDRSISGGSSSNGYVAYYADKVINADEQIGNFYFRTDNDGTHYLSGYVGTDKEITLPDDYNSENYVIEERAFFGCSGLTSVTIGNSVTKIGEYAFSGCSGLTSVTIPNSVTSIGERAFDDCSSLTNITIGNSVTKIGEYAFSGCSALTSVTIPNSVTSIEGGAFYGCSGLTSIIIPNSVTSIGNQAFFSCSNLKELYIEDGDNTLDLGYNYYKYEGTGQGLFSHCWSLETLYIGRNLSYSPNKSCGYSPFYDRTKLTTLTISSKVTRIGGYAFSGCDGLTSITIPNSVTSIGNHAFSDCDGLTSITIPNSVTSIGNHAFSDCFGLTSVTIPNSVTSIEESAFQDCYKLYIVFDYSPLDIKKGSSSNGYVAYYAKVVIDSNTNAQIGDCFFRTDSDGKHYLIAYAGEEERLILPENYNGENYAIDSYAFYACSGLTSVTIPNSVTNIGDYTFYACSGLTNITIGNSVTSIGDYTFYACSGLTNITIGNSVMNIGDYAFYACSSLTNITIGNSVTNIGDYAFYECSSLTSITIPGSVSYLGNDAFGACGNLCVAFDNSVTNINLDVFDGSKLHSLIVGSGVTTISGDFGYYNNGYKTLTPTKVIWLTNTPPSGYKNAAGRINYVANEQYSSLSNAQVYPYLSSMFEVDGVKYVPVNMSERTCDAIDCIYDSSVENVVIHSTVSYKGVEMTVKEVMPYTFHNNDAIKSLALGNRGNIGDYAFYDCDSLQTATITNQGNIGSESFRGCTSLQTATVSNQGNVGSYAFSGCTSLQTATVSNQGNIGSQAFQWCTTLQEVSLSESVASIGTSAFYGCSSLPEIKIPNSVTSVEESAFSDCSALTSVSLGDSVKTIGKNAFYDCSSLPEITIPQSVTSIGDYAFDNCSALADVIISDRTEALSLGSNGSSSLFADCPLDSVYIGGKITYNTSSDKGYSPFYRNTSLRSVVIGDKEEAIYDNEFYGCTNLKSVSIGNGVKSIGNWAFSGCSSLDQFSFGGNVESIGQEAFSDCTNMTQLISSVVVPPTCGSQALEDINKWNCTLKVPANYKAAYQAADQWKDFFFIEDVLEVQKYLLTYVVDGEVYHTDSIALKAAVVAIEVPTKEGHTFSGWSEVPVTMPAQDVTVTGSFTVNKYKLTYTVDGEEYATDSITYGETITLKETLTKEGHTFSGWSEVPATMPAQDVTVTGSFTVNKYKLTYTVDGKEYATDSITYGESITLKETLTKEGHTFSGWSEVPATMPAQDVTVTGSFTVNKYKLTYTVDGEEYATDSITYGEFITLKETLTKEGYTFSGWSEVPATMPAQDVTVTGSFTVNKYRLTYTVDGEEYATDSITYGEFITLKETLTKEGHTFSGWSEVPATMPAQDVTVTGSFTVNSYTLLYIVDGEEYKKVEVPYGETIEAEAIPTKEGYLFSGWSEIPETMPAHDVTVTGSFEADGIEGVTTETLVDVYTLQGMKVKHQVSYKDLDKILPKGIYIINGKKVIVK